MGTGLIAIIVLSGAFVVEHGANRGGPAFDYLLRPSAEISQLYRENGRVVAPATLDLVQASAQCPNGYDVRRQRTEAQGDREFLVTNLKCR